MQLVGDHQQRDVILHWMKVMAISEKSIFSFISLYERKARLAAASLFTIEVEWESMKLNENHFKERRWDLSKIFFITWV